MKRETLVPSIPDIRPDNIQEVLRAIKATIDVREGSIGDPLDQAVTLRELAALNVVQEGGSTTTQSGSSLPVTPVLPTLTGGYNPGVDYTVPPAPTGLRATGGFSNVYLEWDGAPYRNHNYTEIWRASIDNLGDAVLVGTTAASVYADAAQSGATYWYWIRFVSKADVRGPYNQTSGVVATTALDVAALLPALQDEITNSQLFVDLGTRIATAETGIATLQEVTATSARQVTTLSSTVGSNSTALQIQSKVTDGLSAQYTVKIDNNGHVSGFGLASKTVNGTPTSAFIVRADRFAITGANDTSDPLGTINPTNVPFVVLSAPTYIGTTLYPAGVWMKTAFIADATINSAKIQSLTADKITTGTLTAAIGVNTGYIYNGVNISPFYPPGGTTFGTGFFLGNWFGTQQFYIGSPDQHVLWNGSNLQVKGTLTALAGAIGGITIASNGIRVGQTGYNSGSSGFWIGSDGRVSFGNPSGNRMTWDGSTLNLTGAINAESGTIGGSSITASSLQSTNYSAGTAGYRIQSSGNAEFNNVTVRGALKASSLYTGSTLRDLTSEYDMLTTATGTWAPGNISFSLSGSTVEPMTAAAMRFYGPNYHSISAKSNRVRNTNSGQQLSFVITVSCIADHFLTLWYRYNGGSWVALTTFVEPQGDYGTIGISTSYLLSMGDSDYIDFGLSPTEASKTPYDAGKIEIRHLTMTVSAINF